MQSELGRDLLGRDDGEQADAGVARRVGRAATPTDGSDDVVDHRPGLTDNVDRRPEFVAALQHVGDKDGRA